MSKLIRMVAEQKDDPLDDPARLVVTITVGDLRRIVREELQSGELKSLGPDRLVDIDEAAKLLSVSEDYLYHNLKRLPFVRKLGPRLLRFSFNGIQKWIASKG